MSARGLAIGEWGSVSVTKAKGATVWRARAYVRDLDGQRRQAERSGATPRAATSSLVAHLLIRNDPLTANSGDAATPVTGATLMSDVIAEWLQDIDSQELSASSRTKYRRQAAQIEASLGSYAVNEMTVAVCREYLRGIASASPENARTKRVFLSMIMNVTLVHGALYNNPVKLVRGVRQPQKKVTAALTEGNLRSLRHLSRTWQEDWTERRKGTTSSPEWLLPDLIDVACGTGCRIGEILALRWSDVNLETFEITVAGTIIESDESHAARKSTPKSASSYRVLKAPRYVIDRLWERKLDQGENAIDAVFPTARGTWRATKTAHELLKRFRTECAIDVELTWRSFRKAVATILNEQYGLEVAQEQLGHQHSDTTKKHYVAKPATARDSTPALDELFK